MHIFTSPTSFGVNDQHGGAEDSIWPTFTDIMTVVLMIFMFSMLVVVVKNTELVRELEQTLKLEQLTREQLSETQESESSLRDRASTLEEQLRAKEMQILLLGDRQKAAAEKLKERDQALLDLKAILAQLRSDKSDSESAIKELKQTIIVLGQEKDTLTQTSKSKIEDLNALIINLRGQIRDSELTLAKQRSDYTVLEEKYNKLIKPSRSTLGKKVVTVRLTTQDGNPSFFIQNVGQNSSHGVTEQQMHSELAAAKKKWGKQLYVKIVIPKEAKFSYNQAWELTNDLLSKYDYYYQ